METVRTRITPVRWRNGVELLDQRLLPHRVRWIKPRGAAEAARLIADLAVRGAPAIGITAAYALASEARRTTNLAKLRSAAGRLAGARPTATNLRWAVDRVMKAIEGEAPARRAAAALAAARGIHEDDAAACLAIGRHGASLFAGEVAILTHCNAGALATGGIGTALGVVRVLQAEGRLVRLFACEARPVLQGARLTTWEAIRDGIPVTLLSDSAAASLIAGGRVHGVVVGADRIAADGAVANKVGTYPLAVLAHRHGVPFVVAAPVSTFDLDCLDGAGIPIEQRGADEVRLVRGVPVAPRTASVFNPAFDVTPPDLIFGIVSEKGVARPVTAGAVRRIGA
jgi:methylthioribose-1-phosphate isomerase